MEYTGFHTQEKRNDVLIEPILAQGVSQWLGDGFYFWQDYEFAEWWGDNKKCGYQNRSRKYSIYKCSLIFEPDDFIDTVFCEEDYYNFVKSIEKFAKKYQINFKKKPNLEEFNDFIADYKLWQDIKVIRFQDLPANEQLIEVKGFYYKKRIQFRINDLSILKDFVHLKDLDCVSS